MFYRRDMHKKAQLSLYTRLFCCGTKAFVTVNSRLHRLAYRICEGNKKTPFITTDFIRIMRAIISRYHLSLLLSRGRSLFRYSKSARQDFGNTLVLLRARPLYLPLYISDTMALADGIQRLCILLAKCIRKNHRVCLAPSDSSLYTFGSLLLVFGHRIW